MRVERIGFSEWEDALDGTSATVFHSGPALSVMDTYADGDLQLLGGFKGEETVAVLPAFVRQTPVGRTVTSPPPGMGVQRLGPLLFPTSPKRRKQEQLNRTFVETVLDELDIDGQFSLFRSIGSTTYSDPRPFAWDGFQVEPYFTHVIDVGNDSTDELLRSFSRDLRRDMRKRDDIDVTVERGGTADALEIYESLAERYRAQDRTLTMEGPFVRDLVEALNDRCRVYVARDDGKFLSGIIVLYSSNTAYGWQGGTSTTYDGVSVNSVIHREILEDITSDPELDSVSRYDLLGANTERISEYKSAFNGRLVPYYLVESDSITMAVVKQLYEFAT